MQTKWTPSRIIFTIWALLALIVLFPVTLLLKASFPILTVAWIVVPLIIVWRTKDAGRVGFRSVPRRQLLLATAVNWWACSLSCWQSNPGHTLTGS